MLGDIQEGVSVEVLPLAAFPLCRFRTFNIVRSLVLGTRAQLCGLPVHVLKYEYG
jgi:hypothetical protein